MGPDPSLNRKGMSNVSKFDKRIWAEFLVNPDKIVQADYLLPWNVEKKQQEEDANNAVTQGYDVDVVATQRRGQSFFRKIILTSYEEHCALTDIDDPSLLVASHIIGWADRKETRVNPQNGICLNALHDRAFDRHLITFDERYNLLVSENLSNKTKDELLKVKNKRLRMPEKFLPEQVFLEYHRTKFFDLMAS